MLGLHLSQWSESCGRGGAAAPHLFQHAALCSGWPHRRFFFLRGFGLGGSAWSLLGAGAGSGCEHSSWRLEAQIKTEAGGSGWPGFAPRAYLSQKVSSKFHLHSQISSLFFCRGSNRSSLFLCDTLAPSQSQGNFVSCTLMVAATCWCLKWLN